MFQTNDLLRRISVQADAEEQQGNVKLSRALDRVAHELDERTAAVLPQFLINMTVFTGRTLKYVTTRYIPNLVFHAMPHIWNYLLNMKQSGHKMFSRGNMSTSLRQGLWAAYSDTTLSGPLKKIFQGSMEGKEYDITEYTTPAGHLKEEQLRTILKEKGMTNEDVARFLSDDMFKKAFEKAVARAQKDKPEAKRRKKRVHNYPGSTTYHASVLTAASTKAVNIVAQQVNRILVEDYANDVSWDPLVKHFEKGNKKGFQRELTRQLQNIVKNDKHAHTRLMSAINLT